MKCSTRSKETGFNEKHDKAIQNEISLNICKKYEMQDINSYNKLPNNVLLNIFDHLDRGDLKNVMQVCQKWKQNARNPKFWKSIKIQEIYSMENINYALRTIWFFNKLERVYIKNVPECSHLLRQINRCLPNLISLKVRYCNGVQSETIKSILRNCSNLMELDLKGTNIEDYMFYENLPAYVSKLKILNLTDNIYLRTKDIINISLNCHELREFYVSGIVSNKRRKELTDYDCLLIIQNMASNLKGFMIDGATLTDPSFHKMLLCSKLEHFGFHRAYNLNGRTFTLIWKYLRNLKTLKITYGNLITGGDVKALFIDGKYVMNKLTVIDFTGCWKINDEAIAAIADCCSLLNKLILKCCKNLTNIVYLRKLDYLQILNIAFCFNINIQPWLPVQGSLTTLFLSKGNILEDILTSLKKDKRDLKIHICPSQFKKIYETFNL